MTYPKPLIPKRSPVCCFFLIVRPYSQEKKWQSSHIWQEFEVIMLSSCHLLQFSHSNRLCCSVSSPWTLASISVHICNSLALGWRAQTSGSPEQPDTAGAMDPEAQPSFLNRHLTAGQLSFGKERDGTILCITFIWSPRLTSLNSIAILFLL